MHTPSDRFRLFHSVIILLSILFSGWPLFSQPLDIALLHRNDAAGKPAAPYTINTQVTIQGIVTAGTGIYSPKNFEVFIQDSTGGINLFLSGSIPKAVKLGDLVRITGKVKQYYGLTEIEPVTNGITVLSENNPVPEPLLLTCDQVANSFLEDYSEPNESRLIRINDARVTAGSGLSFTLTDHSGSCILFHDLDAKLPNPPSGTFDVIGIIKQYDPSTTQPLSHEYEISPRFTSDLISKSGPIYTRQPRERDVWPDAVELGWNTDKPATSQFRYGLTPALELGAAGDSALTSEHRLSVTGLQPATLYHGAAYSTDATGTTISNPMIFMTSSTASSGLIDAYFSKSIDAKYADGDTANGSVDLSQILIERLNHARYSIDACYYSFTHSGIAEALRNAKKRGVSVRFIYDYDPSSPTPNLEISGLRDLAGIPIISDRYGSNSGQYAMHDKFVVIDYRDNSSALDDYLWVGSANATYDGSLYNGENMLLIQDETLCAAYTMEFNEMWGSGSETPDPALSRFGSRKQNNTPHLFRLNNVLIEQYMSPSDDAEQAIIDAIATSEQSIYFCMLTFTSSGIAKALENQYHSAQGFQLRGVLEKTDANDYGSKYPAMTGQGSDAWQPPADVVLDVIPDLLHHKYAIIDPAIPDVEPRLITGSHNWSNNANTVNDENILIVHDRRIANLYLQEFSQRYHDAGGKGEILSDVAAKPSAALELPDRYQLRQNYPNPFNAGTILRLHLPENGERVWLNIYDVRGTLVKKFAIDERQGGWKEVHWDGRDEAGRPLATGIYFARLAGAENAASVKLLLMR